MGGAMKYHSMVRPLILLLTAALLSATALSGCGTKSTAPISPDSVVHSQPASPKAASVIRTARVLVGYPYKWGGHIPETGFDCSGLTWFVYRQNGINLPRVSWQQFSAGISVDRKDIRPGDLVFYEVNKLGKSLHVGIVTDRATFVHAPSSGKQVIESSLNSQYWAGHYLGARRVL
nr:C40 family peptidase [uncultured Pseudodesulfovibrio sp.]